MATKSKDTRPTVAKALSQEEREILAEGIRRTFQTIGSDLEAAMEGRRLSLTAAAECTLDAGYMVMYGGRPGKPFPKELYEKLLNINYSSLMSFAKNELKCMV